MVVKMRRLDDDTAVNLEAEKDDKKDKKIDDLIGGSTNKIAYLVKIDEHSGKTKSRVFVTSKMVKGDNSLGRRWYTSDEH